MKTTKPQRIYLAGKITKNGWRDTILGHRAGALSPADWREGWSDLPNAILDTHTYVGPYFVGCDHGCAHGPGTHGAGAGVGAGTVGQYAAAQADADAAGELYDDPAWSCAGESAPSNLYGLIVERCLESIRSASLVFAWFDTLDAHGTLVEIGYARALGIPVAVGCALHIDERELWFARRLACFATTAESPLSALCRALLEMDRGGAAWRRRPR